MGLVRSELDPAALCVARIQVQGPSQPPHSPGPEVVLPGRSLIQQIFVEHLCDGIVPGTGATGGN